MLKPTERPRVLDKNDPRSFELFVPETRAIEKKEDDGTTKLYIEGVASSSVKDRMGDVMTEQCQASMLVQSRGLVMWLNHSYKVPEDILGTCVESSLERATDEQQGDCLDLHIRVEIDPENPRAVKSWQHIQRGTKLAFSIGGYFTDFELIDDPNDPWNWSFVVNDIDLIEISLVGIPANPRAYTEKLRSYIVSQAEEIVRAARASSPSEARQLIRKSLVTHGQEARPMDNSEHATKPVATYDVMPDNLQQTIATHKELSDMQQSSVISALRSMKSAIAHGMCQESAGSVSAAHAIVKSLLPDDAEIPDDADLDGDGDGEEKSLGVSLTLDLADATNKLASLNADITSREERLMDLSQMIEKLSAEVADLEQKAEQLKATPAGRSTKSATYSGGSSGNEPTADASLYYKTTTELMAQASRQSRTSDARDAVQVT